MDLCRPVAFAGFQTAGRLLLTPPLFGSMFTTFSLPDSEPSCHLGCLRLDLSAQLTSAPWRREGCCWRTGEIGGYGGVACCRSENPLASWRIEDLSPARVALLKTGGGKCFAFVRLQPVSLSYITQLTGRSTLATLRLGTVVPSVPAQEKHPPLPSAYPVRVRPVWIQPARFPACQPGSHLWKRGSRLRHPPSPRALQSPDTTTTRVRGRRYPSTGYGATYPSRTSKHLPVAPAVCLRENTKELRTLRTFPVPVSYLTRGPDQLSQLKLTGLPTESDMIRHLPTSSCILRLQTSCCM